MSSEIGGLKNPAVKESVFKGVHYSLIDQALLSISNFLIGLIFIRHASKTEYYAYSQLMGYIALTLAVQAALVNTTALTLLPQKKGQARRDMANAYFSLQAVLSTATALLGGAVIWLVPASVAMDSVSWVLAGAMGCMVVGVWVREFLRNVQFINLRPDLCLWQDVMYAVVLVVGLGALLTFHGISASSMLYLLALAGLLTALPWLTSAELSLTWRQGTWGGLFKEIWPFAKWSLPAGLVAWAAGNGYLLIGAQVMGPETTAEVVAAKLFAAPLGMVFVSWANIFRPRVSRSLADSDVQGVHRLTWLSIAGVLGIVLAYTAVLVLAYPHLEEHVLGEKYRGLSTDIAWWGVFFLASGLSGVCNGVLLAGGRFRHSFYAAAISCLISLPVMYVLGSLYGKTGLMASMVLGEATYAFVLFLGMRRLLRHVHHQAPETHTPDTHKPDTAKPDVNKEGQP